MKKSELVTPAEVVNAFSEVFKSVECVDEIEISQVPDVSTIYFKEGAEVRSIVNRYSIKIFFGAYSTPDKAEINVALDKLTERLHKGRKKPIVAFDIDSFQKSSPLNVL